MQRYKLRCWRANLFGKGTVCTWTDAIFAENAEEAYAKVRPQGCHKVEICVLTYEPDGSSSWSIVDVKYPERS